MSISPHGALTASGSVHAIANPSHYDRMIELGYEMWASYNRTVQHEYEKSGRLLALGCDRNPQGGQDVMLSDVAKLRHEVQQMINSICASKTPAFAAGSDMEIVENLRKAGASLITSKTTVSCLADLVQGKLAAHAQSFFTAAKVRRAPTAVDEVEELKHLKKIMTPKDWDEIQELAQGPRGKLFAAHDDRM